MHSDNYHTQIHSHICGENEEEPILGIPPPILNKSANMITADNNNIKQSGGLNWSGWIDGEEAEPILGTPPPPPPPPPPPIEIEDDEGEGPILGLPPPFNNSGPFQTSEEEEEEEEGKTLVRSAKEYQFQVPPSLHGSSRSNNIGVNEPPDGFLFVTDSTDPDAHNKFKIIQRLGKGAYGSVYKAQHLETKFIVALKKIAVEDMDEIIHEITMLQNAKSPRIVRYYGHYFHDDYLWIVLEYCPVGSIADVALLVRDRGLEEELICAICKAVLLGLNYLHHSKKVHRDIKPEYHKSFISVLCILKFFDFHVKHPTFSIRTN